MQVLFGEYKPDVPAQLNDGLVEAENAIPYGTHYESLPSLSAYSTNTLSSPAKGFFYAKDSVGNPYSYAGDKSALYSLVGVTLTDISRTVGGAYTGGDDNSWEFIQWGDRVICTNFTDAIQEITVGASNFHALAGSPPRAKHMAVVRDFVVLGNCTDIAGANTFPNRVHWSAFNNVESWATSGATQADSQMLYGDGGWIQRVVGGEYGIVFQERNIWKMTYVGSPIVFQFDCIEPGRGTPAPGSVVQSGSRIFYLGQDDFYLFNGASSIPIGTNRIYKTFLDDYKADYWYNVSAVVDPIRPLVFWAYPGVGNTGGLPNKLLVYNWAVDKWAGPIQISVDILCNLQSPGYTLDTLDTVNTSIDALPASLDSRLWMGGTLSFAAFDSSHKFATFTGVDMTATFTTGERQLVPGKRTLITNTAPLIEGPSASVSVAISGKVRPNDSDSFSAFIPWNTDGECPIFSEARYHRGKVKVTGGFTKAFGIKVMASQGGSY